MRLAPYSAVMTAALLAACTPAGVSTGNFNETVSGQSFDFYSDNQGLLTYIGSERFFEDQSVVFVTSNGRCLEGRWFVEADQICFNYGDPENHCWQLDRDTPEPSAAFSYSTDEFRQVAYPGSVNVPASCSSAQ